MRVTLTTSLSLPAYPINRHRQTGRVGPVGAKSVIPIGAVTASRSYPKCLELRFGALALSGGRAAIPRGEPKQPDSLVLRDLRERQFATVEIGFADFPLRFLWIGILGSVEQGSRSHLAEEQANHWRGPCRHVELLCGFRQMARGIVAALGEIVPQGQIGIFGDEFVRLLEIRLRVGDGPAIEIEAASGDVGD